MIFGDAQLQIQEQGFPLMVGFLFISTLRFGDQHSSFPFLEDIFDCSTLTFGASHIIPFES